MPSPKPASSVTHVHTGAILSSLYLHFPKLVALPATTLLAALPFLVILQSGYLALLHSPPVGNTPKTSTNKKRRKPPVVVPTPDVPVIAVTKPIAKSITSSIVPLVLSLGFSLLVGTPAIYLLLVLFGAPVTSHFDETVLTAAHLALLAIYPLAFKMGSDGGRWRSVLALEAGVEEAYFGAVGTFVGAWAGAVPIPLGECSELVGRTINTDGW